MAKTSSIDSTKPADNVAVDKADLRANFTAAKEEINDLYKEVSLARRIAFGIVSL